MRISLTVNGERREADVWAGESLLFALRDRLGLPGSKNACEQGECGSCSVLLEGELVCSCLVLAAQADGHEVVTVEGLAGADGLHPVQEFRQTGRREERTEGAERCLDAGTELDERPPGGGHYSDLLARWEAGLHAQLAVPARRGCSPGARRAALIPLGRPGLSRPNSTAFDNAG